LIGPDVQVIETGRDIILPFFRFDEDSELSLIPGSRFYTFFPNGVVLFPGPPTTGHSEFSLDLSPANPVSDGYCMEGSLFYARYYSNSLQPFFGRFYVDTKIVPYGEAIASPLVSNAFLHGFESYSIHDVIPEVYATELMDIIQPGQSLAHLPEYLDNCDLGNGNYPSIHFRFMQELEQELDYEYVHTGTIVYGPEDYLEQMEDGRCRFLIRSSYSNFDFGLNFLKKIAVHFQSDRVGFCDPSS
jgi:hypothetical protein